ncbi:CRAL/TRIO domain-containing protein [Artomyces pyxidatus]|uniref:CRAL/TRIO domain-containing protein n=1 Tax=Artomyces pyxidatus TaxID=48021 RepID=A0ACB8SW66_9AGAM|nr:CRAL/TRIO domain-containing protein [Artomyces pyxidatus]
MDDKEPQNVLTRKFSEQEWQALKKFRSILPEIFRTAYDRKAGSDSTPITIWGVVLDPNDTKNPKASVVLMKWLRARNLNVDEAATKMIATLRWRDEFRVENAIEEEFPADVYGKLGGTYGQDNEGRPLMQVHLHHAAVYGDIQRFLRWHVALMEKAIERIDFDTVDGMIEINDYEGIDFKTFDRDPNAKAARDQVKGILEDHYPEFIAGRFFLNMPRPLSWVFWLCGFLIPAETHAKLKVVRRDANATFKALSASISKEQLPQHYGGDATDPW